MTTKRQVCVTGGTGFVGSHVVRQLVERGDEVRVVHRASSDLSVLDGLAYRSVLADLLDVASLREAFAGCAWVFHIAAVADYWRADPAWMFTINVDGTRCVLQAAREAGIERVVFTSSAAAVGLSPDDTPADENVRFNLPPEQFPYGTSKVQAEAVVEDAVRAGQDVVTVNPSVILGPGDMNMISGTFITQMHRWQWLTPATAGSVAIIDVRDVARLHIAAAEHGHTGERYLLSAENITYEAFFQQIADVLGVAPPVFTVPDALLPLIVWSIERLRSVGIQTPVDANQARLGAKHVRLDASKTAAHLKTTPQIPLVQSIADTYQWYLDAGVIERDALYHLLRQISTLWHRPARAAPSESP